jgi:predicted ATPase
VGKTRLALHLVAVLADRFPAGARLADLTPVGPELVADTLARALGVVPRPGWSLPDVLREVTADLRCLLLVDNCEHVVAEAADIVARLLPAGPHVRMLATSREPLGVPGEVTYPVPTMSVPAPDASMRADIAGTFDAVRLFVARAAAASPGFTLTDRTAPAVTALCQRLDGLPLAIELAASRVRSFDPADLVRHLDQRFDLLSSGPRTGPPRHRTLRAAVNWSYQLLDADERTLLDRLGVFPADFDYDAVQVMCADGDLGVAVITLLPRLVDKSLVSAAGRYRLLETIREYAAERLAASGAEAVTRHRHARHYLALAERAAEQLRTPEQRRWLDRLSIELPNLRAALSHTITVGDREGVWRWIAALQRFWDAAGHRREAEDWIGRAAALADPPATPAVVEGLVAASAILQPSEATAAYDLAQRAAQLASGLDDVSRARASRAVAMGAMWIHPELLVPSLNEALDGFGDDHPWETALTAQCLTQAAGDLDEALHWGRRSVGLFRQVGDLKYAANTLFIMAQRAIYGGVADDEVHQWLTESQALAEAVGSDEDRAHAAVGFAQLAWLRAEHADAVALMEQVLPTLRRLGDQRCTGRALYMLGQHADEVGQLDRAEELLRGSIEAVAQAGQSFVLTNAVELLAAVYHARGRHRAAAVLLGVAQTARESATAYRRPVAPPDQALYHALNETLGEAAFNDAHIEGQQTPATQAVAPMASGP